MIYPDPKPPPTQPKPKKPLKRTRVKRVRAKARKGRLKGEDMSALRQESWKERGALCLYCGHQCSEFFGELAHIRGKRNFGDSKQNVAPAHKECHRKFHAYGPSGIKPIAVTKKEIHAQTAGSKNDL